jgi:hypothetical protein
MKYAEDLEKEIYVAEGQHGTMHAGDFKNFDMVDEADFSELDTEGFGHFDKNDAMWRKHDMSKVIEVEYVEPKPRAITVDKHYVKYSSNSGKSSKAHK